MNKELYLQCFFFFSQHRDCDYFSLLKDSVSVIFSLLMSFIVVKGNRRYYLFLGGCILGGWSH